MGKIKLGWRFRKRSETEPFEVLQCGCKIYVDEYLSVMAQRANRSARVVELTDGRWLLRLSPPAIEIELGDSRGTADQAVWAWLRAQLARRGE